MANILNSDSHQSTYRGHFRWKPWKLSQSLQFNSLVTQNREASPVSLLAPSQELYSFKLDQLISALPSLFFGFLLKTLVKATLSLFVCQHIFKSLILEDFRAGFLFYFATTKSRFINTLWSSSFAWRFLLN